MVEGDNVFKEAISFLKSLKPLPPLEWDQNLYSSANEHVNDIGPKGLLLYQSSDGTEPEDRINKYCNYETLGENIDFGPNDAMGVIISLTLDDGEEQKPHRENLFKEDYNKVGIACGPHQTEFQMCVMDFAGDYNNQEEEENINDNNANIENNNNIDNDKDNNMKIKTIKDDRMNEPNNAKNSKNPNNLENEELKNNIDSQKIITNNQNQNIPQNQNEEIVIPNGNTLNDIDKTIFDTLNKMNNLRIVSKKVEITTKVTFTYEDGSTRNTTQFQTHEYK